MLSTMVFCFILWPFLSYLNRISWQGFSPPNSLIAVLSMLTPPLSRDLLEYCSKLGGDHNILWPFIEGSSL